MISDNENKKFPFGKKELKIGIIGMTEGNGHPYSWSAMINGYDDKQMAGNPYPGIYAYLKKQPEQTIGIPGVRVSHIYCDDEADAADVAKCSLINNIVARPKDMIGAVDAVIVATDIGSEHVDRCRPFIEADIPLLIDKPLADCQEDLNTFISWHKRGKKFISSSSMRYTKELEPYYKNHYELGELMYICQPMCKKWETYGIHALEGIYPLLGPGFISVQNTGTYESNMVHLTHKSGCDIHIPLKKEMYSAFGTTLLIGTESSIYIKAQDSYYPFKKQLDRFVDWLRTGEEPQSFLETVELIKMVIGGMKSRELNGEKIMLDDIKLDT